MAGILDPSHPLYSVSLKLERAGEQLQCLKIKMEAFLQNDAYELEAQADPQTERLLRVVRIKKPFPPMWSAMIGEILHNLRCALDYLVFQLIILETGAKPPKEAKIQFPIFIKEPGFDSRGVPTMLKGVGISAIAVIKSLQPFATKEGEKSPLWLLSQLSNWDKHRSISLAGASTHRIFAHQQISEGENLLFIFPAGVFKDNTPLFGRHVPPGPEPFLERARKVEVEGEVTFYVVFKEPVTAYGLSVMITLHVLGKRVFTIYERINKEIFEL